MAQARTCLWMLYIYIMDSVMGRVGLWMTMKLMMIFMMIFIYLAVVVSDYE